MLKLLLNIWILLFFFHMSFAQKNIDWKKVEICLQKKQKHCDTSTLKLFVKVDKAIWKIRNYNIKSRIFITPDVEAKQFYDTIMTIAPTFYTETLKHKETLVNMVLFSDDLIGFESKLNIVCILNNLCIEEYLDVIRQVVNNYESYSKNEEILINLIDQDDNFSGSLKYFYNVEKLKAILLEVKQNKYIQSTKKYDIKGAIDLILSGERYEFIKIMYDVQYLLKPTRCEK